MRALLGRRDRRAARARGVRGREPLRQVWASCTCGSNGDLGRAVPTVVSLTFDDGDAEQYAAAEILSEHSLRATFFVNSNRVGKPGYMTWEQLEACAEAGHEIGGHTLDHVDLTRVGAREARRQVLDDRHALVERGFEPASFAYPFGARTARLHGILRASGYASAQNAWGLSPLDGTADRSPAAESIPPRNIWEIRAIGVKSWHEPRNLEAAVARAEDGSRRWVPFVFHGVRDDVPGDDYAISANLLRRFAAWLADRSDDGTVVRTIREVVPGDSLRNAP